MVWAHGPETTGNLTASNIMNTVKIIVKDKREIRRFASWREALESLRWWVVLDHAERELKKAVLGS